MATPDKMTKYFLTNFNPSRRQAVATCFCLFWDISWEWKAAKRRKKTHKVMRITETSPHKQEDFNKLNICFLTIWLWCETCYKSLWGLPIWSKCLSFVCSDFACRLQIISTSQLPIFGHVRGTLCGPLSCPMDTHLRAE